MTTFDDSLSDLQDKVRQFAAARDWEQFHSPKNLAAALIVEAGELLEHFQWLTETQSQNLAPEKKREVELEMADVLVYLIRLADRLGVDLIDAANRKLALNEEKYPVEKSRGRAAKYKDL
jgi:dCTP diphosphatase